MDVATIKKDLENQIEDINKDLKNIYLPLEAVLILLGKRTAFQIALELIESLQQEQPIGEEYTIEVGKHTHTLRVGSQSDIDNLIRQGKQEQPEVDLKTVVVIDNIVMTMLGEGYNSGYKTRPFYEEVLRRFNARKKD